MPKRKLHQLTKDIDSHEAPKKLKTPTTSTRYFITDDVHKHDSFLWSSLSYIESKKLLITSGTEGDINLWDVANNFQHVQTIHAYKAATVYAVEYLEGSNKIICSSNEYRPIKVLDIGPKGKAVEISAGKKYFNFFGLTYIEDMNCLVAGGYDKTLAFFDLGSKKKTADLYLDRCVSAIKYIQNRNILIVGLWGGIRLIDMRTKKPLTGVHGTSNGYVMSVNYIPEKNIIYAGGDDGVLYVWKLTHKKTLLLLRKIQLTKPFVAMLRNLNKIDDFVVFFLANRNIVFLNILSGKLATTNNFLQSSKNVLMYRPEMDGLIVANHKSGAISYLGHFKEMIKYDKIKKALKAGYREEVFDSQSKIPRANAPIEETFNDGEVEDLE
jgi:WD40 repeat protein